MSDNGDYVNCHTFHVVNAAGNYHKNAPRDPPVNASPYTNVHQKRTPGRQQLST